MTGVGILIDLENYKSSMKLFYQWGGVMNFVMKKLQQLNQMSQNKYNAETFSIHNINVSIYSKLILGKRNKTTTFFANTVDSL